MTLAELTHQIRIAVGTDSGLGGKSLKFDLGRDGVIFIAPDAVSNDDAPADLTMTLSLENFMALGKGTLNPISAVMSGKLKISSISLAMQLQSKVDALMNRIPRA